MPIKNLLFIVCSLVSTAASAQFSAEKYFTDSVSFRYEVCRPVEKKLEKKGIKPCTPMLCIARASYTDFSVDEVTLNSAAYAMNQDLHIHYVGKITSIDFSRTEIVEHKEYSATTTTSPAQVYELRLHARNDKKAFTQKDDFFPQSDALAIYMFFGSYEDAKAVKDMLQERALEIGE
jgi:hypothetical protein